MSEPAAEARVDRLPPRGMVTIRADFAAAGMQAAILAATGCVMPGPRRIAFTGNRALAWMSPDEAMLFLPEAEAADLPAAIDRALAPQHHLAVDMSDARALFRIKGPGARAVLAKGAPVDLAPAAFGPGDFRRSRLGQVAAAFWMPAPDVFELMCFRSVADFVADWLETAARSGGLDPLG